MNPKFALITGIASSALALGWSTLADAVRYAPQEGSTIQKTYISEVDMELDDFSLLVSGQDFGQMIGVPGVQVTTTNEVSFSDDYVAVGDDRPTRLVRSFDDLSSETSVAIEMMGESDEQGGEATSAMDGLTVVFTWDSDAGEYVASWAEDSGGDDDLLEGLEAETDLTGLLPEGDVDEGATWSFDPIVLKDLLGPSGDLSWETEEMAEEDMEELEEMFSEFADEAMDAASELLDGDTSATYKGTREADGRTIGVIELELEISSSADFASLLQDIVERAIAEAEDAPDDVDISVDAADLSLDVEATGELLWDLASGTPYALTLSGDFEIAIDLAVLGSGGGESQDIEVSAAFSGVMESSLSTSR